VYPQDPPPGPQQPPYPGQFPPPPNPGAFPAPQAGPPTYPTYPPYPPAYPPYGYQPEPYQPLKRTEFGWASIIVSGMALLLCWAPVLNLIMLVPSTVLVLAGWFGRHERSRIPAGFGTAIAILAAIGTAVFTVIFKGWPFIR